MSRFGAVLAALLLTLAAAALPARAQPRQWHLGWATADTAVDPTSIAAHQLQRVVEQALPGRVEIELHPNRLLGDETEMLAALREGTLELAVLHNYVVASVERSLQINDLPFIYSSEDRAHRVLDGEVGLDLLRRLDSKGLIGLRFCEGGFRNLVSSAGPISAPQNLHDLRFRVPPNPMVAGMVTALGAQPVTLAWSEVFPAVKQGTVDVIDLPTVLVKQTKIYQVMHYVSNTRHVYSAVLLLASRKAFDEAPFEVQSALRRGAVEACDEQRRLNRANLDRAVDDLRQKGVVINDVGDLTPFRAAVQPIYREFREAVGPDLMDRVLKAATGS